MQKKRKSSLLLKTGLIGLILILAAAVVVFAKEIQETKNENRAKQTAADASGITIDLYYGDQNSEFIISRKEKITKINAESLTEALTEQGILEEGTEVLSFAEKKQEEKTLLDVDFNEKFREKLFSLGTSGERIYMGSVINTFLEAYQADAVKITVEGETLESGHAVYDSYQNFYGQVQQRINVTYTLAGGKQKTVEALKLYSELGFATVYDEQNFAHDNEEPGGEVVFYDLKSGEEAQKKAYMKVTRTEEDIQSAIKEIQTQNPNAAVEDTLKNFGKNGESGTYLTYTERVENQDRTGEIYTCEHNGFTYVIEINCVKGYEDLWGELRMMVDEFYFVD